MGERKVEKLKKERTLVLVKPDGLQRGLAGEVMGRFESKGLKLVAIKMIRPSRAHVKKHYRATKEQLEGMGKKTLASLKENGENPVVLMGTDDPMKIGEMINKWNEDFLTSGPVVAMVFEGLHAVKISRKIAGHTMPVDADIGTIRGDYSVDSPMSANLSGRAVRNIVHASSSVPDAKIEISHWFSPKELFEYKRIDEGHVF